ncbi:hypothetical protein LY78DRAFT_232756 [Colletotrichum sublineola]|nr:hypothetical protein LY78DRAFT_232756 [Colletotrichum sublineola]
MCLALWLSLMTGAESTGWMELESGTGVSLRYGNIWERVGNKDAVKEERKSDMFPHPSSGWGKMGMRHWHERRVLDVSRWVMFFFFPLLFLRRVACKCLITLGMGRL